MRRRTRLLIPLAAAVLLVGAGCGGDNGDTSGGEPAGQGSPATTGTPADQETTPGAEQDATVAVADTSLGEVLVDAEGLTLYMYDPDEMGPSTCYDDCAAAWPPLVVTSDPVAGEGVDQALLGTVERDDGSRQVTYGDWPLYYYAQDQAAGDVTGQAVQDVWWVIGPDGQPIRDTGGGAGTDGY